MSQIFKDKEGKYKFVKASEAAEHYQVDISTLRRWARLNKIEFQVTKGGQYRYRVSLEESEDFEDTGLHIIYCRVSSKKQSKDLRRQEAFLRKKYPDYKLVSDIGSGINNARPGFKWILQQLFKRNIDEVVVAHTDRFTRFGFDLFEWIFQEFGAVLTSCNRKEANGDIIGDIMEIFTVFTARYHGRRKYQTKDDKTPDMS